MKTLPENYEADDSSASASVSASASASVCNNGVGRPRKRRKQETTRSSELSDSGLSPLDSGKDEAESREVYGGDSRNDLATAHGVTAFEQVLPPTTTDEHAIKDYEQIRCSQSANDDKAPVGDGNSLWVKGRSSIYVDAFNLALDTVLADESELFDEKEMEVFRRWRLLNYEAKYL